MDNLAWLQNFDEQNLPDQSLDFGLNLSPNTLDAICREYPSQTDARAAQTPAGQALGAEQHRILVLEEK